MTRRAAPGPQLAIGRLRVDATRAIAKLREYQLADRTAWILEAIRAAVASGATEIELRGDSNDVWLWWDGSALAGDDLPRLFDELVSPEPSHDRQHLRLLAAAVNSALGMNPAYVDVFAIGPQATLRARYTPDVLDEPASDAFEGPPGQSKLGGVVATRVAPPEHARPGTVVHLHRRVSLEVISYFLHHSEPPELGLARTSCRDIAVPLRVGDDILDRHSHRRDVLRVPLGEGLDGWLALVDPATLEASDRTAVMEVAEHGVVLARYPLDLDLPEPRGPLPLRLFVDATRMPTNASRSQVRRESHPIAAAETRARALVPALVAQLVALLAHDDVHERPRAAALALLATAVAGADWRWDLEALRPPLRSLAGALLVRDATGAPRPVAAKWSGLVYTRRAPLDAELAPWLDDVLWIPPGDPSALLVEGCSLDTGSTRRHIRWARRQRRAHDRFYDHEPRAAHVEARTLPRIRVPLAAFGELTGEVCIFAEGATSELVVLLQGREIDRQQFDSPIAFAAVIDAPRLAPADRYRGVRRDEDYARVETAMRAGVLRAVEGLALALIGEPLPPGFVLGEAIDPRAPDDALVRIVQHGLALARASHVALGPPLTAAPAWQTVDGDWISLDELAHRGAIGIVFPGVTVDLADRVQLRADRIDLDLLGRLLPSVPLVRYERTAARDVDELVARVMREGGLALVIRDGELLGAIAPAAEAEPRVVLHHVGIALGGCRYPSRLVPCSIAVDSDAIVPDVGWRVAKDDTGLASRDYLTWETALVRSAALALLGERPADLLGDGSVALSGELGRTLCVALARADPIELLGAELVARLRVARLVVVLGEVGAHSAEDLVARYPSSIPYVDWSTPAVAGYHPLLGDAVVATAIARLVGARCHDGTAEVELHRRLAVRAQRLAAHRSKPVRPLALPAELDQRAFARGVVAINAGTRALELRIHIEGRPFQIVRRDGELPLIAMIELDAKLTDALFETIPADLVETLVAEVCAEAPALLVAIAQARPTALGDPGPARTLLAAWLARDDSETCHEARDQLCHIAGFVTLQGGRVSLAAAATERHILSTAGWHDTWLPPDRESAASPLDEPILLLAEVAGELATILALLHRGAVVDVTDEVTRLQAHRRMARGLLPVPTVVGIAPTLKRRLGELGELGRALGHGEIGLVDGAQSQALLHRHGVLVESVALDVLPPIHLAIESPELIGKSSRGRTREDHDVDLRAAQATDLTADEQLRALRFDPAQLHVLTRQAQELATRLVRKILHDLPRGTLPDGIRRGLRRAVLAGRLAPTDVPGVLLFETIHGAWLDWAAIEQQLAWFGNVWALVTTAVDTTPLDDHRIVIRIAQADLATAREHGFMMVDATKELALDAVAREHRARPAAQSLAIASQLALGQLVLDGDGVTELRGTVAVLTPEAAQARGVRPHRAMHPFDLMPDPCRWPTLAMIDDARLAPNRTWAQPFADAAWKHVVDSVRAASERTLAGLVKPPTDALVAELVDSSTHEGLTAFRAGSRIQLRGALWLVRLPGMPAVKVHHAFGAHDFVPARGIGLGGTVFVYAPDGWSYDLAMEELCAAVHGRLLRALIARTELDPGVIAAHAAHGLALGRIVAIDARRLTFPCFLPRPLDASALAEVLAGIEPIRVLAVDEPPRIDALAVIEDGSELSRVVIAALGARARRTGPEVRTQRTTRTLPPPPPLSAARTVEVDTPAHPLRELVDLLRQRLAEVGVTGPRWTIADCSEPMLAFTGTLRVAGDSVRLRAVAAAHLAQSPWAAAAIDAVVAHALTVLNIELSEITDAAESRALGALLAES